MATEAAAKKSKGLRLDAFKSDVEAETRGVWVDYATGERVCDPDAHDGLALKVARAGNVRYQEALVRHGATARRRHPAGGDEGNLVDEGQRVARRLVAKFVLLDWRHLLDDDGNEIPYSLQKAQEILAAPEYHQFYEDVIEIARDRELFARTAEKEAMGN